MPTDTKFAWSNSLTMKYQLPSLLQLIEWFEFGYRLGKEGEKIMRIFNIFLGIHTNTNK